MFLRRHAFEVLALVALVASATAQNASAEEGAVDLPDAGHLAPGVRELYYSCWSQSHPLCGGYSCGCGKGCTRTCYYTCTLCYCSPGTYTPNGYGYVKSGTTCPNCPDGQYQNSLGSTGCKACPAVRRRTKTEPTS